MRKPLFFAVLLLAVPALATAESRIATLELDGMSFISFGDSETYQLPAGATLRFRFGDPLTDGSVPFSISPLDVHLEPVVLGNDASIRFGLAQTARGLFTPRPDGTGLIEFTAAVAVFLTHPEKGGSKVVSIRFTTESTEAKSLDGSQTTQVSGMRVPPLARAVQFVGAATNAADDYPGPGAAVHAVLSGTFDQLPGRL